jgi:hypothetical protein
MIGMKNEDYGDGPLSPFLEALKQVFAESASETSSTPSPQVNAAIQVGRERVWLNTVLTCLQGGWNARRSVDHADTVLKAFEERGGFGTKPTFGK